MKIFSLTENQFSGKIYFYTIRPSLDVAHVRALILDDGLALLVRDIFAHFLLDCAG